MYSNISIYVHIPFCMSKCSYCSFVSKCASEKEIEVYFTKLTKQIEMESEQFKGKNVETIYFGGGTPSAVSEKYICDILGLIYKKFNVTNDAEISTECNPCSVNLEKLVAYKKAGFNRISFGVQNLNDECLAIIGRKHNSNMAIDAIQNAIKAGFTNISCDLLIGIPKQTTKMLLSDIRTLVNLGVKHISAYMLMLEEGTKLYEQVVINHLLEVAKDDECINMYNKAYNYLKDNEFFRYEISNFAKTGYECKHNINYWDNCEYVGFGLSAHSYFDGKRIAGIEDFEKYYQYVDNLNSANVCTINENAEVLSIKQKIEETIMLGLRQTKGVNLKSLLNLGYDLLEKKKNTIKLFKEKGLIDFNSNYLFITPNNFGASNQIILELLP